MKYCRALAFLLVCALSIGLTTDASAQKDRRGSFTIQNNTSWSFYYIYISDPSDGWGDDQLGSEVLSSGETMSFNFRNGTYDIKIQDEDGDECIIWGYEHRGRTLVFNDDYYLDCIGSDSYVSNLTIENNTLWSFYYIYISDPDDGWGNDQLGSDVLSSGETMSFNFGSGTYDIKIIDEDDDECIIWGYEHYSNSPLVFDDDDWLDCIN